MPKGGHLAQTHRFGGHRTGVEDARRRERKGNKDTQRGRCAPRIGQYGQAYRQHAGLWPNGGGDTDEELDIVRHHCEELGVGFALNTAFGEGGKGAEDIARLVVETIEKNPSKPLRMLYDDADDIETKVRKIAQSIYGANDVVLKPAAKKKLARIKELGLEHFPVCVAKTQYSFSEDAKAYGLPTNFDITIRDFVINTGSEMIVAVAGDIMRMPGLPKSPQAERIDVVNGVIEGLS